MRGTCLAIAVAAAACGDVVRGAEGVVDASPGASPYAATLAQTEPTLYGDSRCQYSLTMKQLSLQLDLLPSGEATAGSLQNSNVEVVLPQPAGCPFAPFQPTITRYTFESSTATATGHRAKFQPAKNNAPAASLDIDITKLASGFSARLTFKRTDQSPPLDWTLTTSVTLAPR